jgi:hypothetical protein
MIRENRNLSSTFVSKLNSIFLIEYLLAIELLVKTLHWHPQREIYNHQYNLI